MEWTAVTALVVLVGLITTVVRPVVALTQTITKLTVVVNQLDERFSQFTQENSQSHRSLWAAKEEQSRTLTDHERRIGNMERI